MIVTKEFIKEQDGNCLDHICIYVDQLQFIGQVVYDGAGSLKEPVFYQYSHGMVIGLSEMIRDAADQIKMVCDAADTRDGRHVHEIRFLKEQVNKLVAEDVADGLLAAFRKQEASRGSSFFSDTDKEVPA